MMRMARLWARSHLLKKWTRNECVLMSMAGGHESLCIELYKLNKYQK